MDPAAQQQIADADADADADKAAVKAEAEACLFQMVQTTRCFNKFCNDMQAAVNELSQHDVTRYLEVTLKCDYLKDRMMTATNQSAMFLRSWLAHPDVIRHHIAQITLQLSELRGHRNRIAELYMIRMVCDTPHPRELERNLDIHMNLLQTDVHRIFIFTGQQLHLTESDFKEAGLISKQRSPAPQEG